MKDLQNLEWPALSYQPNLLDILFDRMPIGIAILDRELRVQRFTTWAEYVVRYSPGSTGRVVPGVSLLWLLVIVGFVAAGIGVFGMQGWWRNFAVASAIISLLAIGLFVGGLPLNPTINPVVFDLIILATLLLVHWPSVNMVGS